MVWSSVVARTTDCIGHTNLHPFLVPSRPAASTSTAQCKCGHCGMRDVTCVACVHGALTGWQVQTQVQTTQCCCSAEPEGISGTRQLEEEGGGSMLQHEVVSPTGTAYWVCARHTVKMLVWAPAVHRMRVSTQGH